MSEHTFPFDKKTKLPFSDLERFCQHDRQAFSLYVSVVVGGAAPSHPVSMSEKTAREARKRLNAYLAAHPLNHSSKESIFQYLDQLHRVDIRLLSVYFYVSGLYGQAWRTGKPLDSVKVNHRELAAHCKPMDFLKVPELLHKLSGPDMIIVADKIGANETLVRLNTTEDAAFYEAIRDSALECIQSERQDREERMRFLPTRYGNPDERFFSIPSEQRPDSNQDIHDDVLKLLAMFNGFASKPDLRKVAKFPVPSEYKSKGVITATGGVLRAIEDWIFSTPDWYEKWSRVLEIAESNLYLKGKHHGTHTPHIEGDADDFIVKDIRHRYGKPTMNLAWFFTINTSDDPLRQGFHLDMVLAEHYEVFTDTGMQHLFDLLTPTERRERLEHIVSSFNALQKTMPRLKPYHLSPEYFSNPNGATGGGFLDGILDWTCQQTDWQKEWLARLTHVAKSRKKNLNLIDTFEEMRAKPKLRKQTPRKPKKAVVTSSPDKWEDWTALRENEPEDSLKAGYLR